MLRENSCERVPFVGGEPNLCQLIVGFAAQTEANSFVIRRLDRRI